MALTVSLSQKELFKTSSYIFALYVEEGFKIKKLPSEIVKLFPQLEAYCNEHKFTGKAQTILSVPVVHNKKLCYIVLAGLGKKDKAIDIELYRRAVAKVIRFAQSIKASSVSLLMSQGKLFNVSDEKVVYETALISEMTDYVFDTFKEQPGGEAKIAVHLVAQEHKVSKKEIERAHIVAEALNNAREWVNLPANILRPDELAAQAKQIAKDHGLNCTIFNEKKN